MSDDNELASHLGQQGEVSQRIARGVARYGDNQLLADLVYVTDRDLTWLQNTSSFKGVTA
jgi:hypothetical protein